MRLPVIVQLRRPAVGPLLLDTSPSCPYPVSCTAVGLPGLVPRAMVTPSVVKVSAFSRCLTAWLLPACAAKARPKHPAASWPTRDFSYQRAPSLLDSSCDLLSALVILCPTLFACAASHRKVHLDIWDHLDESGSGPNTRAHPHPERRACYINFFFFFFFFIYIPIPLLALGPGAMGHANFAQAELQAGVLQAIAI